MLLQWARLKLSVSGFYGFSGYLIGDFGFSLAPRRNYMNLKTLFRIQDA